MKFARNVSFTIKPGKETEFTNLFEKEVVPMLRKQNGFLEEVTLVNPKNAIGISLWDNRQSAETYQTTMYPQVLAKLVRRDRRKSEGRDLRDGFQLQSRYDLTE